QLLAIGQQHRCTHRLRLIEESSPARPSVVRLLAPPLFSQGEQQEAGRGAKSRRQRPTWLLTPFRATVFPSFGRARRRKLRAGAAPALSQQGSLPMASVFPKFDRRPVPADAEIITRKGERFARFKGKRGKTLIHPLDPETPAFMLVRRRCWYIKYLD